MREYFVPQANLPKKSLKMREYFVPEHIVRTKVLKNV